MRTCPSLKTSAAIGIAILTLAACGGASDLPSPALPNAPAAPTITAQPANITVAEGSAGALSVTAQSNDGPISYQWRVGSTPTAIPGANQASYATPATTLLDEGKVFSVVASNSAGTAISQNATLSVTERTWTASQLPPTGAAGNAVAQAYVAKAPIVTDSLGHAHALIDQIESGGGQALWAAFKPAGGATFSTFTRLTPLPVDPSAQVRHMQLAADGAGRVLAVWKADVGDEVSNLWAALYSPSGVGGQWGDALLVSSLSSIPVEELPQVVASAGGRFDMVWRAFGAANQAHVLYARRLTVDSSGQITLEAEQQVAAHPENVLRPRLASDGQGRLLAAWSVGLNGHVQTYAAARLNGGDWSAPSEVDALVDTDAYLTNLVMNRAGQGVLVMKSPGSRLHVRQFVFNGTAPVWNEGPAQYVANQYDNDPGAPVVLIDEVNRIHIVAVHGNGRQLSRWRFDASWQGLESIRDVSGSALPDQLLYRPSAGLDAAGNLIVTWNEVATIGEGQQVRAARHHVGLAQWRPMASIGFDGLAFGGAGMAVHGDGSATLLQAVSNDGVTLHSAVFR